MPSNHSKKKLRPGVDRQGRTPLHLAAASSQAKELAELLKDGANPNAQDDSGWSPLHFAAQAASLQCIQELIQAGANVSLQDSSGNTALFRAVFASRGDGECIRFLRQAGADPHTQNNHGVSPVSLARTIANYDVAQFFADLPGATS